MGLVETELTADLRADSGGDQLVGWPRREEGTPSNSVTVVPVFGEPHQVVDDLPLEWTASGQLLEDRVAQLLPDPRHGEEDRRAAHSEVFAYGSEASCEPGLSAHGGGGEVTDHSFGDVAQWQEREEPLLVAQVEDRGGAAKGPHDVRVTDHCPLWRTGRTTRIDKGGQIVWSDCAGTHLEQVRLSIEAVRANSAQSSEPHDEQIIDVLTVVERDYMLELGQSTPNFLNLRKLVPILHKADPYLGVPQNELDLLGRARLVDRDRHSTAREHSEIG